MDVELGGTAHSPEDVKTMHELGLKFAEIPITDPDSFMAVQGKYRQLKDQLGLYYLCHGPRDGNSNDIMLLKKVYLPKVIKVIKVMPELNMDLLTLHLWLDHRFVTEDVIRYKMKIIKAITTVGNDFGITVCVENLSENPSDMEEIFEALPLLGLTLDVGHAQLLSPVNNSFSFIKRYPDRIKHIHLHDNLGGDSAEEDLHLPVGKGIIDFYGIFKELKNIGYVKTIALELRPDEIRGCLAYVKALLHDAI